MKFVQSDVHEVLVVGDPTFVYGTFTRGLRVLADATLFVIGNVGGSVTLDPGARMVVLGEFSALVDANRGDVTLAGAIRTPLSMLEGHVDIAVGTLVPLDDGYAQVTATDLRTTSDGADVPLGGSDVRAFHRGGFGVVGISHDLEEFWRESIRWR